MVVDYNEATDLATVRVYLDGVEESELQQLDVSLSGASTVPAVIAGLTPDTESFHVFRGLLDCVRILPQVLTTEEFLIAGGGSGPDLDDDDDVDSDDHLILESCASGPGMPHSGTPNCEQADLDGDNDVDQNDFAVFQRCISAKPWDPACLD